MLNKFKETRRKNFQRWKTIREVTELLNKWRDFDDESYKQEAIRVLTFAR